MHLIKLDLGAILASLVLISSASAGDADPALAGVSLPYQQPYRSMKVCLQKTIDAGAPESIRPQWEKQIADSVKMFRAMRGQPGVEETCKQIAANPDCN